MDINLPTPDILMLIQDAGALRGAKRTFNYLPPNAKSLSLSSCTHGHSEMAF